MTHAKPRPLACLLVGTLLLAGSPGDGNAADFGISLQAAMSFTEGDEKAIDRNDMNRGENPFSPVRLLLLTRGRINETTDLFLEVPVDLSATSSTFLTYFRPFLRLTAPGGQDWLNLQVGKLPTRFGAWGERSNSTGNALIGLPLMFYYHTTVRGDLVPAGPETFLAPGVRGAGNRGIFGGPRPSYKGVPLIYDACWDIGTEAYGARGGLQYSLSATLGTVSNPAPTRNYNDGYGFSSRLGWQFLSGPLFGLRLGASGAVGPYLDGAVAADPLFPKDGKPEDFLNTALGLDLTYARGPWQFFAEAGQVGYEVPNVAPVLRASAYYVEVAREFGPQWSIGIRRDGVAFSDLDGGEGNVGPWDYEVRRWEATLNWRFQPGTRLRAGTQLLRYPDAPELDGEVFALQLQVWTR